MNYQIIWIPLLSSWITAILIIPLLRSAAVSIGLVDKPNARKVHVHPTALAGGIAIAIVAALVLTFVTNFSFSGTGNLAWMIGSVIMLITGALDDRFNIRPTYRLIIQFACGALVASAGIRIHSLYGIAGIYELPEFVQYGLTILVIAGVVNAYNLMDGIDGLLGTLTLIGAATLGIIAWTMKQYDLAVFFATLSGAILGFLRFNLGSQKIFMGDAGSLMLGFILVTTAIRLLTLADAFDHSVQLELLLLVVGIFIVPVFDSLRVYRARIKNGVSPFQADKTHLHHLLLILGVSHKRATLLIAVLVVLLLSIVILLATLIPGWWALLVAVVLVMGVSALLSLNKKVNDWKHRIKQLEQY